MVFNQASIQKNYCLNGFSLKTIDLVKGLQSTIAGVYHFNCLWLPLMMLHFYLKQGETAAMMVGHIFGERCWIDYPNGDFMVLNPMVFHPLNNLTPKKSKPGNQGMAIQIRKYTRGFASIGCNALFDYGNSRFPNMLYSLTKCCWIWANYIKEITNSNWRISFLHHVFFGKMAFGKGCPFHSDDKKLSIIVGCV